MTTTFAYIWLTPDGKGPAGDLQAYTSRVNAIKSIDITYSKRPHTVTQEENHSDNFTITCHDGEIIKMRLSTLHIYDEPAHF